MEDLARRLGWKKLAAIMIFVAVLFLGFLVFSFLGVSNKKPTIQQPDTNIFPTSIPTSAKPSPSVSAWLSYKNSFFEISYPENFTFTEGRISTPGDSVTFASSDKKIIEIQIYASATTPLENILNIFRGFHYVETSVGANTSVHRFKGAVAGIQENVVVFENNGKIYKLQLSYGAASPDSTIEQTFSQMVATFKLL